MRIHPICLLALLTACGGGGGSASAPTPTVPSVGFLASSGIFSEGDLGAPILLALSGAASGEVRVPIVVGLSSSATMGVDYQLVDLEAVFPAGQTLASVRVNFLDDNLCEGDELLRLLLGTPSGDALLGAMDTFDAVLDGTVVDLEPNDSAFDAVGNGPIGSLVPGSAVSVCAEVTRQPGPDNTDAFLLEVLADVNLQIRVSSPQGGADLILIVSEPDSTPIAVVDLQGNGESEAVNLPRPAGGDFVVAVSTTNTPGPGWLTAPVDLEVTASVLLPPALDLGWPQPEPDPVLTELVRRRATWAEILEARMHP